MFGHSACIFNISVQMCSFIQSIRIPFSGLRNSRVTQGFLFDADIAHLVSRKR